MFAGHAIDGGWVSFTVTVKLQLDLFGGVAASLTEQVTVVTPFANVDPDAGTQVGVPTPGQLSLTVGAAKVTTEVHKFGSVDFTMVAGHVIDGA